jgi:hypothetical protein
MDNSELLIREMINRADMRLQAQQSIALASDARAMQFVATCVAGAAIIVALGGNEMDFHHFVVAGALAIAAFFAFMAALPVEWHAPGMRPSAFEDDVAGNVPVAEVLRELCGHLDKSILENNAILKANAGLLRVAAVFAVMAPILGGVAMFF